MKWFPFLFLLLSLVSCMSMGYNNEGSAPINREEIRAYSAQVIRCYKMGGTRIVKIDNFLRCF
jgi:hypothetical protein